jgi:hypothetical protein
VLPHAVVVSGEEPLPNGSAHDWCVAPENPKTCLQPHTHTHTCKCAQTISTSSSMMRQLLAPSIAVLGVLAATESVIGSSSSLPAASSTSSSRPLSRGSQSLVEAVHKTLKGEPSPNIGYQIHSNNDLREMPQLLLKGARRFKFDPHYLAGGADACGEGKESCLLLNHDVPMPKLATYSSSDDLLELLTSDSFAKLTNGEYVSVALCFKSAPDRCQSDSTEFADWLRLADDFFERAKSVPSNVEIILDGDSVPKDCLLGRWLPHNSVWIRTGSTPNAFYDNNAENDDYRYQILNNNENISNWEWMATPEVNYGKFSNSTYPYQLWEPDHQDDYQEYISIYRSGQTHAPGFNFAINTDMVRIENALFRRKYVY